MYNKPSIPNLGDMLCTPRKYFRFRSDKAALIVGGGAFSGLGVERASKDKASIKIAWGIGQSFRFGDEPRDLDLPRLGTVYAAATTRDPLYATGEVQLLPCVSVLHPVVDLPIGSMEGLFLNRDEAASGNAVDHLLDRHADDGIIAASNAMGEDKFSELFAQTQTITTNSYHAAYWALLSGRGVRLIGYSTKFLNVLRLFNLPDTNLVRYRRGDGDNLIEAVKIALDMPAIFATSPEQTKARFREMNLSFADKLRCFGIEASRLA